MNQRDFFPAWQTKRKENGCFICDISAVDRKDTVGLLQLSVFFLINVTLKIASHEEGFRHIQGPWERAHHDYTLTARDIDGNRDKE